MYNSTLTVMSSENIGTEMKQYTAELCESKILRENVRNVFRRNKHQVKFIGKEMAKVEENEIEEQK